jgi:hypothetical protein
MWRNLLRKSRGWLYRRLPAAFPGFHRLRVAGFNRRWDMENRGWTQEDFSKLCWENMLGGKSGGRALELSAGDGLVGSLGRWLESHAGWEVEGWEGRALPRIQLGMFRPRMRLLSSHGEWQKSWDSQAPDLVTSRTHLTNALLIRFLRGANRRPRWVGVWNRSGRGLWAARLGALGYRLELCQDRMEFYSRK